MINEVTISRLDNLIGEFDTPFFNYLIYSYNLSLNDCELTILKLKKDIKDNKIKSDNLISTVNEYFKQKVIDLEKQSKIEYLDELLDGEFFNKYLKKYNLSDSEINIIYHKVESKILKDNISDFEIKRYLKYYFLNSIKQISYLKNLDMIVGVKYDTLIIKKAKKQYPILRNTDIVEIINNIKSQIIDAKDFKNGIKEAFIKECMLKSESKKAMAKLNLEKYVEGSGDSFLKLIEFKNLSKQDGELIINDIKSDINNGLIQPDKVNGVFLTMKFNEYIENEG